MKILVPLRVVLDPAGFVVNRRAQRVFVNREEYLTNPADRCALEAAVALAEADGAELVAACVAPPYAEPALREALALGATAAYRLDLPGAAVDEALAARALAALVSYLGGADLILTGASAPDAPGGQTGPRLAELLGWAFLGRAWRLAPAPDGGLTAVRRRGNAWEQARSVPLPAVVTIPAGANKPRLPNGARLIEAYAPGAPLSVLTPAYLGLSEGALEPKAPYGQATVSLAGQVFPPERRPGHRPQGSLPQIAAALARTL